MNRFGSPPLGGFRGSGDLEGLSMGDPFRVDTPPLCNPGVQAPPAIERRRFQRHHGDRTGICRTFGQEFHFAPYPAWNLSYLRSGISFRSIPCLESVVPSVRDFTSLHTLPGICRTFGQGFHFAPYPAWNLSYLRHFGVLWHTKQGLRATRSTACLGSAVPSGLPCRGEFFTLHSKDSSLFTL